MFFHHNLATNWNVRKKKCCNIVISSEFRVYSMRRSFYYGEKSPFIKHIFNIQLKQIYCIKVVHIQTCEQNVCTISNLLISKSAHIYLCNLQQQQQKQQYHCCCLWIGFHFFISCVSFRCACTLRIYCAGVYALHVTQFKLSKLKSWPTLGWKGFTAFWFLLLHLLWPLSTLLFRRVCMQQTCSMA